MDSSIKVGQGVRIAMVGTAENWAAGLTGDVIAIKDGTNASPTMVTVRVSLFGRPTDATVRCVDVVPA